MSAYQELKSHIHRTVTFEPCLPRPRKHRRAVPGWLHEIKHDGFRIIAQKDVDGVRLITRNGYDFAERYPLIVDAIRRLSVKSCIVDGEAIVVDQEGLSVFDLLRYRRHDHAATLCAFDLIEVDGADLRAARSRNGSGIWPRSCGNPTTALRSTRPTMATAQLSTSKPVRSAARVSSSKGLGSA